MLINVFENTSGESLKVEPVLTIAVAEWIGRPLGNWEVMGSNPGWGKPKYLKLVSLTAACHESDIRTG